VTLSETVTDAAPIVPSETQPDPDRESHRAPSRLRVRATALLEILLCSGYPTQLFILAVLASAGLVPRTAEGRFSASFIATLSLADAALLITIIMILLVSRGERPSQVFLGMRSILPEVLRGVLLIPASFLIAVAAITIVRLAAPVLHNVAVNPLEQMLHTARDRVITGFVVVVAGGLREEIQRAFILHRFEQSLGGAMFGLVVFSLAFGAGHLEQGRDVAIATAALGAFWGFIYLRRRSIIAPAVAHAGFNLSEILRQALGP
jgi:membrane protease YdiL (CAAX protease family)